MGEGTQIFATPLESSVEVQKEVSLGCYGS